MCLTGFKLVLVLIKKSLDGAEKYSNSNNINSCPPNFSLAIEAGGEPSFMIIHYMRNMVPVIPMLQPVIRGANQLTKSKFIAKNVCFGMFQKSKKIRNGTWIVVFDLFYNLRMTSLQIVSNMLCICSYHYLFIFCSMETSNESWGIT
jgi:hypothetical protein